MEYKLVDLELVEYNRAWQLQRDLFHRIKNKELSAALIFCRHHPVITLGRGARGENLLVSADRLQELGISVYNVERGGDITYHGPGQLVVYPIINLSSFRKDIHWYLRRLEDLIIGSLGDSGVRAERRQGLTGAWVSERKIASVGIAIKNWITFHGLSINIEKQENEFFDLIRPCGMDIEMTSLEEALGRKVDSALIKRSLISKFNHIFQMRTQFTAALAT